MASSFPGGLDALTNPTGSDTLDTPAVLHSSQHANANDAIEAIEGALGVNLAGVVKNAGATISFQSGLASARPVAGTAGRVYIATDTGTISRDTGSAWTNLSGPKTIRLPHTWTIPNPAVASGDTDYIMPMVIPVPAGQTAIIARVVYAISSGTSVTFSMYQGAGTITGLTGLSATTALTGTNPTSPAAFTNEQSLVPTITAVSGTPRNFRVTAFVDYTV